MTDIYWERLMTAYAEMGSLPPDHPTLSNPDLELAARLAAVSPEEVEYQSPDVSEARDVTIEYAGGAFGIRVYTPNSDSSGRPLLVWCHGGAWAAGDLEGPEGDATAREVVVRADAVVISVDYRLATHGVHFPTPLNDVVEAYRWARENAETFGADPDRITLAGASAGGNLAAGAALWIRDHGLSMPISLALAYPALHPELPAASAELQSKLDRLNKVAAAAPEILTPMIENYLGAPTGEASPYAMPGVSEDLSGLPPTYIFNNEYDGLRASAEKFAYQLAAAGNRVVLETLPDVAHGHFARPGLTQSRGSHRDLAAWVTDQRVPSAASIVAVGVHATEEYVA